MRRLIEERLGAVERRVIAPAGRGAAAVAVTLLEHASRVCFVLTRRAEHLPRHPGQWSLPGGRLEPGESAAACALRELREEVGIALDEAHVLGALDDFATRSGWVMTPVVLWAGSEPTLVPDPREVAAAYRVPLEELDRADVPRLTPIDESDRPVLSIPMPYLATEVFAPTAAILYQLREVVLHARHTEVAHYEQPLFAWR